MSRVFFLYRSSGVVRKTRHPMRVAVLYFSMSFRKPTEEVCRPPVHTMARESLPRKLCFVFSSPWSSTSFFSREKKLKIPILVCLCVLQSAKVTKNMNIVKKKALSLSLSCSIRYLLIPFQVFLFRFLHNKCNLLFPVNNNSLYCIFHKRLCFVYCYFNKLLLTIL